MNKTQPTNKYKRFHKRNDVIPHRDDNNKKRENNKT